jgi:hypothetical protein
LSELVRKGWVKSSSYSGAWLESRDIIFQMFGTALQSTSPQLVHLIQVIANFSTSSRAGMLLISKCFTMGLSLLLNFVQLSFPS